MRDESKKTAKKVTAGICIVLVLSFCLCLTTFALAYATLSVEYNVFSTANMRINLNDGKPVVEEDEFYFAPGMTVTKEFFLENQSTIGVYYKIYFEEIEGGLADVLIVTVRAGDEELYKGRASEFLRNKVEAAENQLGVGATQNFEIEFHFPSTAGNAAQGQELTFKLAAEAVQAQNNPFKRFD